MIQCHPTLPEYDTLFGNNLDDKVMVSRILMSHYEKRKHLLKWRKEIWRTHYQCGPCDPVCGL